VLDLAVLSDATGWFGSVWDRLGGRAERHRVAEDPSGVVSRPAVPVRQIISAYAGGVGLNSFLAAAVRRREGRRRSSAG
jgi:hypothetical protein